MMRKRLPPQLLTVLAGLLLLSVGVILATGEPYQADHEHKCEDFLTDRHLNLPWAYEDCVQVWTDFSGSLPTGPSQTPLPDIKGWRDVADEMRRNDSPCLVWRTPTGDGVGSTSMRFFAAWIFAEQIGCEWITPEFQKKNNGSVYCHPLFQFNGNAGPVPELPEGMRPPRSCSSVDWVSYFQWDAASTRRPESGKVSIIKATDQPWSYMDKLVSVQHKLQDSGLANMPWDHLVLDTGKVLAARFLLNLGWWDDKAREATRTVLGRARHLFHRQPREWYSEQPEECLYDEEKLHFALHVRLGDRIGANENIASYVDHLEAVMKVISTAAEDKGLHPPLFHVFTETIMPCPSQETGLFDEFPSWPMEAHQVMACSLTPTTPPDTFQVVDKAIVVHLGTVEQALSCMIQADGVVMGCSTFGQVAGLLSKGISMFSTRCTGFQTAPHYKMIPPLAVAERGHMWVPVTGSWHDPELNAIEIFRGALDTLVDGRNGRLQRQK